MKHRLLFLAVLSFWILFGCASQPPNDTAANKEGAAKRPIAASTVVPLPQRSVMIVYGDKTNALGCAELLQKSGLQCELALPNAVANTHLGTYDLVVILSCCRGNAQWKATFLDNTGNARVLACGEMGAGLLQAKNLLIGSPNGWHGTETIQRVLFPKGLIATDMSAILKTPYDLQASSNDCVVEICSGTQQPGHIGIYDGGQFPPGTTGIGREEKGDMHHWIICRQGNYTFWGANCRASDLTKEGKALFANLAVYLAHLPPQPLIFPQKRYLADGTHNGVLTGGSRDKYYVKLDKPELLNLTLTWQTGESMMFMTHGPLIKRVDGRSPLTIAYTVPEESMGREILLDVGSFSLKEGEQLPYKLGVSH